MGNAPLEGKGLCCSASDDIQAALVETVGLHHLSSNALALGADPGAEEEVEVSIQREKRCAAPVDTPLRRQLLFAVRQDDAPRALQHVAEGADVRDIGDALRLASSRGAVSVARELVAVGISVNEGCPHTGFTPLHVAATNGHTTVCELLLDALADVRKLANGGSALSLARKMGNVEVEAMLVRHLEALVLQHQREGDDEAGHYRRTHVLPRISPDLSESVLQASHQAMLQKLPPPLASHQAMPQTSANPLASPQDAQEVASGSQGEEANRARHDSAESRASEPPEQECSSVRGVLPL